MTVSPMVKKGVCRASKPSACPLPETGTSALSLPWVVGCGFVGQERPSVVRSVPAQAQILKLPEGLGTS
jgi:hypothetical protein